MIKNSFSNNRLLVGTLFSNDHNGFCRRSIKKKSIVIYEYTITALRGYCGRIILQGPASNLVRHGVLEFIHTRFYRWVNLTDKINECTHTENVIRVENVMSACGVCLSNCS